MIDVMLKGLPFLWQGLLVTLEASAIVGVLALIVGVILGIGLSYGPRSIRRRAARSTGNPTRRSSDSRIPATCSGKSSR